MKIYFAGSIRGGRGDASLYMEIIKDLQKYGEVLTEHVGLTSLTDQGDGRNVEEIFNRDLEWLTESDLIVAEVTTPSLGVGYELGLAEVLGKPVLALFCETEGRSLSAMVRGNAKFIVKDYTNLEEAKTILREYFTSSA